MLQKLTVNLQYLIVITKDICQLTDYPGMTTSHHINPAFKPLIIKAGKSNPIV